ncbi:MAG: peptidyl-alpha-hydroxyglycine alpha-amidating lyase family protein [Planctomycetota bacterium]|nr:peptidyl-alpha-hydroxyglycine alpha-amidating lyase family protein [Planctomycetota bacterium]
MRTKTGTLTAIPLVVLTAIVMSGLSACRSHSEDEAKGTPHYAFDGNWPQRPAEMQWGETPGVTVDGKDQVWIFTRAKPPVQVYDKEGKFVRAWGDDDIKTAHYIRFDREGKVWVADMGKHVVMQFTPEGKLLKTLGTPGAPGCDDKHLNMPTDMVVTPAGDVFVTDGYGNNRVAHFDKNGNFVKDWGKKGGGPGEFVLPHSIVVDSKGILYVADRSNARIQVFEQSGKFLAQWQNLMVPWGLWITSKDEIWACGSSPMQRPPDNSMPFLPPKDQVFMKFDTSGKALALWTVQKGQDGKEQPGELNWLHGVALDSSGNIYASDIKGHKVQKFALREGGPGQ